ncbi:SDR family oxidoreductase [Dyadobacter sp. NIV53]|uniref:SDR family NAD(P)-dependent oxidoreductase n=1 Tax=Dyadobacter sp. NIV53 TaxID=2861765 RepID=UPI001C88D1AA|nr:SDR family NAD(P)-dependent oxidoreductase [Dyadobacter sp. NIV53]
MSKSILIIGAGPGFSTGVAEKFGAEGYTVGLISRNTEKLQKLANGLEAKGITCFFAAADASNPIELEQAITELKTRLGGISVLLYNAAALKSKDIWLETPDELAEDFKLNVAHALYSAQLLHEDLKSNQGAVLLTGGSLAKNPNPKYGSLALGKAGILNLAHQLNQRLKPDGIFVGTITINGFIRTGSPTHSPDILAQKLWTLFQNKTNVEIMH